MLNIVGGGARRHVIGAALCASAWLAVATAAAAAPAVAPLLRPVRAFAAAFNAQGAYPASAFTPNCTVIDTFAPFAWSSPGAPRRWYAGLVGATPRERRAIAATHARVVFGAPQYARIAGQRAYLVVPGTLTLTLGGRVEVQRGRWTLSEVRTPAGWRIASQAWDLTGGYAGS